MLSKEQPENANAQMDFTLSGMMTFFSDLHPPKTPKSIIVTLSGMTTLVKEEQSEKALRPILVTLSGIVMLSSDLHPLKALSPMFVTLSGSEMLSSKSHPWKALSQMISVPGFTVMLATFFFFLIPRGSFQETLAVAAVYHTELVSNSFGKVFFRRHC